MLDIFATEESVRAASFNMLIVTTLIITVVTLVALFHKKKGEKEKIAMFIGIVVPSVVATLFMSGSTIYMNTVSETGGPVHWHVDFEIWKCGEKVNLLDPTGIENRIGTPVLHEHNDDRIHVEGTVIKKADVSLGEFFHAIGGEVSNSGFTVPTNDGTLSAANGESCDGGDARMQAFVYRVTNPGDLKKWVFVQEKLSDVPNYIPSPYSIIPPGDCVIIEFGEEKEKTDKMCETTRIAIHRGELSGS